MACPNKNLLSWSLLVKQGYPTPYELWDRFNGEIPMEYYTLENQKILNGETFDSQIAWFKQNFKNNDVIIHDFLKTIGNRTQLGYMTNAAIHLSKAANPDKLYHEAFHLAFRNMLNEKQRDSLYKDAEKQFGDPTLKEINNIKEEIKSFYNIELSDEEAKKLVLEEKMSDNFMEYKKTDILDDSILGSINKFFKDLWIFIKSLLSNSILLSDVYYILGESRTNNTLISKGIFRNPEQFKTLYNPNSMHYEEDFSEAVLTSINQGLTGLLKNAIKNNKVIRSNVNTFIGKKNDPTGMNVMTYSLLKSLYNKVDDSKLDFKVLKKAAELENNIKDDATEDTYFKFLEDNNLQEIVVTKSGEVKVLNTEQLINDKIIQETRKIYRNVVLKWDTIKDENNNIIQLGWRDRIIEEMRSQGFSLVKSKEDKRVEIEDDEQDTVESDYNPKSKKTYNKSFFELDPADGLSDEVILILSDIPIIEITGIDNITGANVYNEKKNLYFPTVSDTHDTKTIYALLKSMMAGEGTWEEKLEILKTFANEGAESYKSVYRRFKRASPEESLILAKFLTNHKIHFTVSDSKGKSISAASNTYAEGFVSKWRGTAVVELPFEEMANPNEDYLYYTINESNILNIHKDRFDKIASNYKVVKNRINSTSSNIKEIKEAARSLGELIWNLGMSVGNRNLGLEATIKNTINYIIPEGVSNEERVKNSLDKLRKFYKKGKIEDIIKTFGVVSKGNDLKLKTVITNYHDQVGAGIKEISKISSQYSYAIADKISNPTGGQVFPIHYPTTLSETVEKLLKRLQAFESSPGLQDKFGIYSTDNYINNNMGLSLFFDALQTKKEGYEDFYLKEDMLTKALALRDKYDQAYELQFMGDPYILVHRLTEFINNGNKKYVKVAAAAAERSYMDFILMPRIKSYYNKGNVEALTKSVINELYRIRQNKEILRDPKKEKITGVNDSENGSAFNPELFGVNLKFNFDEGEEWIVQDYRLDGSNFNMSDIVDDYVMGKSSPEVNKFEDKLNEIVTNLMVAYKKAATANASYFIKETEEGVRKTDLFNSVLPWKSIEIYSGSSSNKNEEIKKILEDFLVDFLIQEDIGRNEIIKLTFGSLANFKNLDAFTKRTKLLTAPKMPFITQANMGGNINPKFSNLETIDSIIFSEEFGQSTVNFKNYLDQWVNNTKIKLLELRQKYPDGPYNIDLNWLDSYKAGSKKMQIYDGYSGISMPFYREIKKMMSENNGWTEWEEEAYQNYLVTGEYVYPNRQDIPKSAVVGQEIPITALKPIGLDLKNVSGINMMDISKTAWIPLLKGYTKNFPVLDDIRQRMELNDKEVGNPYVGKGLKPVHILYSETAKKGPKLNVMRLSDYTANGTYIKGGLTNVVSNKESIHSYGMPQFMQAEETSEDSEINLGVQLKKNAISNVFEDEEYFYNAGTNLEYRTTGKKLVDLYHKAFEELINRGIKKVDKALGIENLRDVIIELRKGGMSSKQIASSENFINAKQALLNKIKNIIEEVADKSNMSSRFLDFLDITTDEVTGIPRFTIPLDFPVNDQLFSRIIYNLYNRESFKQHVKGLEAVQTPQFETVQTLTELDMGVDSTLKFAELVDHPESKYGARIVEAEVLIRPELMFKYGLKEGQKLDPKNLPEEVLKFIGYRVPNQDKATTIIFKVKGFLDSNYSKIIVVPPQIVALMGSDYDVDKLFLIFPNLDENGNKVIPNYQYYNLTGDLSKASDKEVQNLILDTIMAVWSNPLHLSEVLKPSNPDVLTRIEEELMEKIPTLNPSQQLSGGMYFNTVEANLQRAQIMRGMHSNALSGRQVAIFAKHFNIFDEYAIKIEGEVINNRLLKAIPNNPIFKENAGVTTDQILSRYIHKHVDSTNDINYANVMNDNNITFPITLLWNNFYGDSELLHYFLNQPIIREFTTIMGNDHNWNNKYIRLAYKKLLDKYEMLSESEILNKNYRKIPETISMSRQDILNFTVPEDVALANFMKMYIAGSNLKRIFKVITPDTSEGVSRVAFVKSFIKNLDVFDIEESDEFRKSPFYGETPQTNILDQFYKTSTPAYGTSYSYLNLMNHVQEVAEIIQPIENSAAFKTFKEAIIKFSGNKFISPEMDIDITRGIWSAILVKEGSPVSKYFNVDYSNSLYKKSKETTTLIKTIENLKKKYPELNSNPFLSKITKKTLKDLNTFYVDMYQKLSPSEKDAMQRGIESLLFSQKSDFAKVITDEELNKIRKLGIDICLHNLISKAFRQDSTNYMNLIPPTFWVHKFINDYNKETKEDNLISIIDYINSQTFLLGNPKYFDNQDLVKFFRTFGKMLRGGQPLLQRYKTGSLDKVVTINSRDDIENNHTYLYNPPKFMVMNEVNTKNSSIYMFVSEYSDIGNYVTYLNIGSTSDPNNTHWYGGSQLNPNPRIKISEDEIINMDDLIEELKPELDSIAESYKNPADISQICSL